MPSDTVDGTLPLPGLLDDAVVDEEVIAELTAAVFSPPTAADVNTMGTFMNLVVEKTFLILLTTLSIRWSLSASGTMSILFSTTISFSVVISPITMHSAV